MKIIFNVSVFLLFLFLLTNFQTPNRPTKPAEQEPKKHTQGVDNPYEASEFRYKMLSRVNNPSNEYIDLPSFRKKAIEYTQQFLTPEIDEMIDAWAGIGPGNIGGRIRSIVLKPGTPSTLLIGAVAGGVWKSTNSGANWTAKMDGANPISIGCILVHPNHPDTVFAGSGEGWGNSDAVYGGGINISTDFGETWDLLGSTSGFAFRNVLKMDSDTAGNIYAITKGYDVKGGVGSYTLDGGLFKSTNTGDTWTKISSSTFTDNYFNPTDIAVYSPSEILFAVNNNGGTLGGIYRTTNSGTNWTKITSGLPSSGYRRISLAKDPSHTDTIYSVFQSTDVTPAGDGGLKGIFKSTNRGVSWTTVSSPPKIPSTSSLSYLGTQGWYDNVIAVDPFSSGTIYVGGVDLMKTTNDGTNWSQLTYWHSFYGSPVVHADHHAIAFDPTTSGVFYNGNDGGIYSTTNSGTSWTNLNNGLEITQYYGGDIYPIGTVIYGGTQDNGHLKYSGGTIWSMVFGGDGGYAAIDKTDSSVAYEEYVYLAMSKTTDGGASWAACTTGLTDAGSSSTALFIAPFSMNPLSSSVLIAGANRVWVTTNGAGSWEVSTGLADPGEFFSAVTINDATPPYTAYAGETGGKIIKCVSLDPSAGLDTWTVITPPGFNGAWVRRIVINNLDTNLILACYSGYNTSPPFASKHVWLSSDGGTGWSDISTGLPNVPVHTAVFEPTVPSNIYVGTETGIYKTTNLGVSWSSSASGMPPSVPVDELVLQGGSKSLVAFTHGRSVFFNTIPLPVELASFVSYTNGNNVTLNWATSQEMNNEGFDIERKISTGEWNKVGYIMGVGNSNSQYHYGFTDRNLETDIYNYRLKQMDFNGNFKYHELSNEVIIGVPQKFTLSQNYPNPFNPSTKINFELPNNEFIALKVYDISGKEIAVIINTVMQAGYHTIEFNTSKYNLSSGVYFYRIQNSKNEIITKRMVLVK